jgi:hypothetical protein
MCESLLAKADRRISERRRRLVLTLDPFNSGVKGGFK